MHVRVRVCAAQDSVVLTPLGLHLSRMPVDVRVGHPARSIHAAHGLTPTHATAHAEATERRYANRARTHARTHKQTNKQTNKQMAPDGSRADAGQTAPSAYQNRSGAAGTDDKVEPWHHTHTDTHACTHARTHTLAHTRSQHRHARACSRTRTRTNTHAHAGKMILFGAMFRCVEPTLAIAAMMGAKSVRTKRERGEAGEG